MNGAGDPFFARNQDYWDQPALLLFTNPPNAYASVSLISIGGPFGFNRDGNLPSLSNEAKTRLLFAPFFLSDGMNEWGFTIGDMAAPGSKANSDSSKKTLFESETKRYLLDHARNTEEAIDLLTRINISYPMVQEPTHFLMADPSGNSAVVEWNKGEMVVMRNENPWQVATNHLISDAREHIKLCQAEYRATGKVVDDINGRSYLRYVTAWETLQQKKGHLSSVEAMDLLSSISLAKSSEILFKEILFTTQWSVVYNMKTGDINVAMYRKYDQIHKYNLKLKQ